MDAISSGVTFSIDSAGHDDPTATYSPVLGEVLREIEEGYDAIGASTTLDPSVVGPAGSPAPTVTVPPDLLRSPYPSLGQADTLPPPSDNAGASARTTDPSRRLVARVLGELPLIRVASHPTDVVVGDALGEGGMGRVDLARQVALDRDVAIKRLRPDRSSPAAVHALLQEGRVTGALEHPNIVPVHALGLDETGKPVLVMKRVEGVSWRELIRAPDHPAWGRHGGDRLGRHLEILIQVCNATQFAHSRGVIHRDLKTENVMVGSFGEVYVLDWGIAIRKEDAGIRSAAGTPAFMAPEMLDGTARVDERTDVFLLGAMLCEALTGLPRHRGRTTREVLDAARRCDPPELGPMVPPELAELCARATAKDPADRPQDALAFQDALADYQRHRGSVALADLAAQTTRQLQGAVEALASDLALEEPPGEEALELQRDHIRRLSTEARFGYRQALREWPENTRAKEGLDEALATAAAFELSERNAFGAADLMQEMATPSAALEEELQRLRWEREVEERAQAELAQIRHDQNPGVALAVRSWVMFAVHGSIGASWMGLAQVDVAITHGGILFFCLTLLTMLLGSFWALRTTLLANQFNRRMLFSLCAFSVFTAILALLGMVRDIPVDQLALSSFLGIGLMFAVLGATLWSALGLLVPPTMLGAAWCAFYPDQVHESLALFNFGAAGMWLVPLAAARLGADTEEGEPSG